MVCPNIHLKSVTDDFNSIVLAFGGRPLTDDEFRSAELRMQRSGLDKSAAAMAYKMFDLNNGYPVDCAPNGKKSILFQLLDERFGREEAIRIKGSAYTTDDISNQISLVFERNPKLQSVGSKELYRAYLNTIFPNSKTHDIYWHGSDSDFSNGFKSAVRGKGSGAPETKIRNDLYLAKQAWTVLQYVSGVNRNSVDKNGFAHWNKLYWEFKEIMSNGRRGDDKWKDLIINSSNVRQAIPNKKGIFNRDKGGNNGKWLRERKADYGYENKSDKQFFEEILGVKWGKDTFNTWTQRNAEIFKSLQHTENGIYPAVINTTNPINESGENTYYEEERQLMTKAAANSNDAILGNNTNNEFGSDVAVVFNASSNNVHFLGTKDDILQFSEFIKSTNKFDINGEPLIDSIAGLDYNSDSEPFYAKLPDFNWLPNEYLADVAKEMFPNTSDTYNAFDVLKKLSAALDNYKNYRFYELIRFFDYLLHGEDKYISRTFGIENVYVKFYTNIDNRAGYYDINNAVIYINLYYINEIQESDYLIEVFLHELIHSITVHSLVGNDEFRESIQLVINYIKERNPDRKIYGLTNPFEFISEYFSNGEFLHLLLTTPPIDKKRFKNLFLLVSEYILDFLARIGILDYKQDEFWKTRPNLYHQLNDVMYGFLYNQSFMSNPAMDKLGTTTITARLKGISFKGINLSFNRFSTTNTLGESAFELNQGMAVSSVRIMSDLISKRLFSPRNMRLADVLARHDIPIKFDNLPGREIARAIELKDGGTVIVIDLANAAAVSNLFLADTILHEIIHACTVKAINTPITEIEKKFARSNKEVFKLLDKAFPKDQYSRYDVEGGYYILKNEKEFAAVYLTDRNARLMMLQKAMELDNKRPALIKALRNFINAFTKFLVNKEVFKTDVKKLQEYENIVNDYLVSMPTIERGNIKLDKALKVIYDSIDEDTLSNEQLVLQERLINSLIEVLEYNPMLNVNVNTSTYTSTPQSKIRLKFSDVADALTSRLLSVKVSDLPQEYKIRLQEIIEAQIQQFRSDLMSSFAVISSLLSLIKPQIKDDLNAIKAVYRDHTKISPTVYMYQRHDNFGTYQKILQDIQELLIEPGIISILINDLNNGGLLTLASELINRLKTNIADCISVTHEGETYMKTIKGMIVRDLLKKIGQETHSPTMGKYLGELEKIGYDTSAWFLYAGSADKAKDDGLRALAYMVNRALNKADRKSNAKSIQLLVLLDKLKAGESVQDLYELDDKGLTTGYMVRRRNYGLFYKDYNEFLANLNLGKTGYRDKDGVIKYIKTTLDPKNRIAPDDEEDRIIWNLAKIQWLSKRADKKYLPKYYEAYSKLSYITAEKREAILSKIRILRANVTDKDGNFHMEDMTEDDYRKYKLYIQERRILTSDYDINGHKKDRGSIAWKIAKELQQLNEDLYGDKNADFTYDEKRWNSDRDAFINKKISEGMSEQEAKLIFDSRASKRRLKKNADGKSLLFEYINKEFKDRTGIDRDAIKYDLNGQYQKNKEEIQKLLAPYFDVNIGEYSSDMVPAAILERIKELELENRNIKSAAASNPKISEYNRIYQEIFLKYAVSVPTQAYIQMKQEYEASKYANFALQIEDDDFFMDDFEDLSDPFVEATEYVTAFWGDGSTITQRYRWFNAIKPLPEYEDLFVDILPGDQYIINENEQSLLNSNFDESENMSMVPKLDYDNGRYDNSKAYNKIKNSDTLNALYEAVYSTIKESNEQFENKSWHDDYLLPQMTGSYYKRLKNQESKAHASWEYLKDTFGILEQLNTEFGMSLLNALNNVDELGEIIMSLEYSGGSNVSARRPNGRQLNMIPLYYTKKLEDPSQISADLVGIVCEYYRLAYRYSEKLKIKDSCEAVVDMMEDRIYQTTNSFSIKKKSNKSISTNGADSNTAKVARKFLDMNLYNIRNQRYEYNIFGYDINLGKAASLFRAFTVALNLGMNIAVAATGFFTASYAHIINAIVGTKYGVKESHQAGMEVMYHLLQNGMGAKYIGDKITRDKIMLLAELYNLSSQGTKKYEHSNRNRAVNAIWDNWCFGMLTSQDFIIKSQIMVSTLMSFRYYNGHFITREDLLNNMHKASMEDYTKALAEWEDSDSVYSVMYVNGHHIEIEKKYKKAYEEIENVLHNRIQKYSESADGMATETQKAAITTNFLGAAVLTHRQYLPLMLTERFGEMVWDMDTQQYTGGINRTGFHYLFNILGMFVKDLITSFSIEKSINNYKTNYDSYFNDVSTIENAAISNARKQLLRQIIAEQIVFWGFITPAVGILAALADDDDNKDKLALQLAAYIARRTLWETYTPYRYSDLFNNIKTVSAQTGTMDKIGSLGTQMFKYITPQSSLYDTFISSSSRKNIQDDIITRGVYKDWTKFDKAFFQMFPIHNLYEQWYGSKDKRKYYENQIMNK